MKIKITYTERSELKAFHFDTIKPTFHDKWTFIVDKFIYRLPAIIYKDGEQRNDQVKLALLFINDNV